jgi:thiol:disulfide interchange protein DsbA
MRFLNIGLLALAAALASGCKPHNEVPEPPEPYTLGEQYKAVISKTPPADPKRITVEEFFWYGCPHCFHLEPELTAWLAKKPDDIDFTRTPNTLGRPEGEVHARAFYIAKTMGIGDKVHTPLFDALQVQHLPMSTLDDIRGLFVQTAGIQPNEFDQLAHSFLIDNQLRQGEQLAKDYGISSVPTIVVGGEYEVDGQTDQMKVVDFVIGKVRKERKR